MKLGFIGLGKMGKAMVLQLLEKGVDVVVYNRSSEKTEELKSEIRNPKSELNPKSKIQNPNNEYIIISDINPLACRVYLLDYRQSRPRGRTAHFRRYRLLFRIDNFCR
jgi:pyrroline-5-carboxylate reductase